MSILKWRPKSGRGNVREVSSDYPFPIQLSADLRVGSNINSGVTLPVAPGTVRAVDVPDWAKGVVVFSVGTPCQFTLADNGADATQDPEAFATVAAGTGEVDEATFKRGVRARADTEVVRLLDEGTGRELRFISATASQVVEIEFF